MTKKDILCNMCGLTTKLPISYGEDAFDHEREEDTSYFCELEGIVVDQITNEPVIGASINIKGTTHAVQTDLDGKFYFQTGQKYPYTLIISSLSTIESRACASM